MYKLEKHRGLSDIPRLLTATPELTRQSDFPDLFTVFRRAKKNKIQPIRFTGTGSHPIAHRDASGFPSSLLNSGAIWKKQVA